MHLYNRDKSNLQSLIKASFNILFRKLTAKVHCFLHLLFLITAMCTVINFSTNSCGILFNSH